MSTPPQPPKFTVAVKRATFIPDADALREFVKELKAEFDGNPSSRNAFSSDPEKFLGARGVATDLQRELLTEAGIAGAQSNCSVLSCIATDGCLVTRVVLT